MVNELAMKYEKLIW